MKGIIELVLNIFKQEDITNFKIYHKEEPAPKFFVSKYLQIDNWCCRLPFPEKVIFMKLNILNKLSA